jgi:Transposase DDE domain/Transposase domain (DUF772)
MNLRTTLSQIWGNIQYTLFPMQEKDIGPISEKHKKLISILELVKIEHLISHFYVSGGVGRPCKDRSALARAFIAKIIFKFDFTNQLRDHLLSDKQLRRICGWESSRQIPSESKFSRVFEEFAKIKLPEHVHASLIKDLYQEEVIGHVTRDSTPIRAREKPEKKQKIIKTQGKSKGRPKKGQEKERKLTRIEQQFSGKMTLEEMENDLPKQCDYGKKKSPDGYPLVWKGYKLHVAVDDHCIPLAAIVSSASLQDNQAAIPLGIKANNVAKNFYDLMDSIYDVKGVIEHSRSLGHVPIVDKKPANHEQKITKQAEEKRRKLINWLPVEERRYKERRKSERFNALFKEYYGGRLVRYRGHLKATCHLMFGVLTLAASLLLSL